MAEIKHDLLTSVEVPDIFRDKWQAILDILSTIMNVPAALIMRLHADEIEVFSKSSNTENPYKIGEMAKIRTGLYCEEVLATREFLLVSNALDDPEWKHNPDIALGMVSYLGFPLRWPTGHLFGTICVLDKKENNYSTALVNLLSRFQEAVESALALIYSEKHLQESYDALKKMAEWRDQITDMIVHDMRNIMTGLSSSIELLAEDEAETAEAADILSIARSNCQELSTMVKALLDVSRLEAGEMPINLTPCGLLSLAQDVAAGLTPMSGLKDLQVTVTGENVAVMADMELTHRIISNLVGNAIKFTPESGTITVEVQRRDSMARLEVRDTGQGVPQEYHERIFDKFAQVHAGKSRQKHSTGMGLTFCKMAVEVQSGEIGVESEQGKGSTFWFTLPMADA